MKCILCGVNAKTNEEFRKVLKNRNCWALVLILIGLVLSIGGFIIENTGISNVPSLILGFYSGVGTGLEIVGIIILIRNRMLLKSEEKLKEGRLNETDERLIEVGNRALRTAFKFMLTAIALVCLVGIIFPVVLVVMMTIMLVFLLSYYAAYIYYKKVL